MRVLLAFDKFKDSLTAREACETAARALRSRHPDWQLDLCPLADGGDGFAEVLSRAVGGSLQKFPVSGPLGGWVDAAMGLVPVKKVPPAALRLLQLEPAASGDAPIAVIEMAAASGLALLPPEARDPWLTSSYGTGQLIRAASEMGATAVLLGVGGSATNDLGLGALSALGYEFRTATGGKLRPPVPATWSSLALVEGSLFPSIPPIRIACDVSNPLLGVRGATAVYGPQKGLKPADFDRFEAALGAAAELLAAACGAPAGLANQAGAGAAGGISFGLMAGARARLLPGFELVAAWLDLPARLAAADLVITGEGRFDQSSSEGKGPGAVAAQARALGKPLHLFAGQIGLAPERAAEKGWHLHAITPAETPLPKALREAAANLAAAVQRSFS
jgi:glycerate kinase